MSTVLANTITAVGGGGSTLKMANDATYVSDGGAVTQNTVQGLCKVWCLYRQSDNARFDDFNISSTDDDATGQVGFNFTNNMSGQTYSTQKLCQVADAGGFNGTDNSSIETNQVTLQCRDQNGNDTDSNPMAMTVHGDLA
tara:strand:+ start:35 stop:454 length:420 start_codon:yes stop_codon:yes gene_type:complete